MPSAGISASVPHCLLAAHSSSLLLLDTSSLPAILVSMLNMAASRVALETNIHYQLQCTAHEFYEKTYMEVSIVNFLHHTKKSDADVQKKNT